MRIAALCDIHSNLPALEAVLQAIERERPDLIVVCGDVAGGPLPRPTIERLMTLGPRAHFVRGNTDRDYVAAFDGQPPDPTLSQAYKDQIAWGSSQFDRAHRDFLASFTDPVVYPVDGIGDTVFCHGTPRDEDEIFTVLASDERLGAILAAVTQPLVVCGHTHMQFDRRVAGTRVVNAGSVGMPYGETGAFWVMLGPEVSLRREEYDLDAAAERIRAGGYPWAEDFIERNLRHPAAAAETAAYFERLAIERGQRAGNG